MSPKLHLVSHILCPYVQRAVITLLTKDIPHERTYIDLSDKPTWFLNMSPLGKVPVLIVDEQHVLFESAVICEYLDEITPGTLLPADPLEKARHRAWIEFGSSILNSIAGFYNAPNEEAFEQKRQELIAKFTWLEKHLGDRPYFAGEHFSLVDGVYGPIFRYFDTFETIEEFQFFATTLWVQQWRSGLSTHPSVKHAVTEDYPEHLSQFLLKRNSYLSSLMN
ncbi:MAG: glutathione S-transferase family protein [Elainellaceae cyanobacterium]